MLYLYLDESGDLGFDFVNHQPSNFFTVSILAIRGGENRKIISNAVKRTIKNKVNNKKKKRLANELKAVSIPLSTKKYFLRHIQAAEYSIYSLTFEKMKLFFDLVYNKARCYNWMTGLLLDKIDSFDTEVGVLFTVDKSKTKYEIKEFNDYIRKNLERKINPKISFDIKHRDSTTDPCLSAIDLFTWGFFRKYEQEDEEWFDCYKDKIIYDSLHK